MERTAQELFSMGIRAGGSLPLSFVNTVRGRTVEGSSAEIVGERMVSYSSLLQWGELAGLISSGDARALGREAAARPRRAEAVLKRSLAVRETLFRVFRSAIANRSPRPADLQFLNRELRAARAHQRISAGPRFRWTVDDDERALDRVLWPVLLSAADLLTSAELERVGSCPGPACGWLFLDTSRSGRRRWCDMAECGNLDKVRRFRRRERTRASRNRSPAPSPPGRGQRRRRG